MAAEEVSKKAQLSMDRCGGVLLPSDKCFKVLVVRLSQPHARKSVRSFV